MQYTNTFVFLFHQLSSAPFESPLGKMRYWHPFPSPQLSSPLTRLTRWYFGITPGPYFLRTLSSKEEDMEDEINLY